MTGFVVQGHIYGILHFTIVWFKNTTVFTISYYSIFPPPGELSGALSVMCVPACSAARSGSRSCRWDAARPGRRPPGAWGRWRWSASAAHERSGTSAGSGSPAGARARQTSHTCPNITPFNELNALETHIPPSQTDPSRFRSWLNSVQRRGSRWPKYTAQPGRKNSPEPHPSNTSTQRS